MQRSLATLLLCGLAGSAAHALDLQYSKEPGRVPPRLTEGEIATNTADGRLIYRRPNNTIGIGTMMEALPAGRKMVEQGDGSDLCVLAEGTVLCRTAPRTAEEAAVLDRGADPVGRSDSAPAFAAASAAAANTGHSIAVAPGEYRLDRDFEPPAGVPFFSRGATFTTGRLANIGDLTNYPNYTFLKTSTTPDTDTVVNIGMITRDSPAPSNYQKSALFVRATTYDSGNCTGTPLKGCKDIVGITATGNVGAGVKSGRAYGMNITSALEHRATGSAVAVEFDVYNKTGIDHTADFYAGVGGAGRSTIYATNAVCGGNAPCDAAFYVSSLNPAQAKFAAGIRMLRGAVRDYVLEVNDDTVGNLNARPLWIKSNGDTQFASLTTTGTAVFASGFFSTHGTIVGANGLKFEGVASAGDAASITATTGPIRVSAAGASATNLGSATSPVVIGGAASVAGVNGGGALTLSGASSPSGTSAVSSTSGPIAVSAKGSAPTYLGSLSSPAVIPATAPASASATCIAGAITFDTGFVYVCVAANSWKRAALSSW